MKRGKRTKTIREENILYVAARKQNGIYGIPLNFKMDELVNYVDTV